MTVTHTEYVPYDGVIELIAERERNGWAVRQLIADAWESFDADGAPGFTATRYFVVFERPTEGP